MATTSSWKKIRVVVEECLLYESSPPLQDASPGVIGSALQMAGHAEAKGSLDEGGDLKDDVDPDG